MVLTLCPIPRRLKELRLCVPFADDPIFVAMLLDFHALLTGNRSKLYQTPKTPTESRQ